MPLKKKAAKKKRVVKKKVLKNKVALKKKTTKAKKRKILFKQTIEKKPLVLGIVTHYFNKIGAAVVKLKAPVVVGDTIKIKGHTTDLAQKVTSIQIDHIPVNSAKKGQEIGLLVESRVRQHDEVQKT